MSSLDLGELYAKLAIDYSDLHKAEMEAKKFVSKTNGHLLGIQRSAENLKSTGKFLSASVTAPILGIGAAAFKASRDFNSAFIDVDKNVKGLDSTNIKAYRNEILKAGQSSLLGASGIAVLTSEAGKLGDNTKDAMEFARAAEMIAVAFDFGRTIEGAQAAGDIIGDIRTKFGLTTSEVLKLADSINYLGDNTSTQAKEITEVLSRTGSVVKNTTSLTDAEIAALSATFAQFSPNAESAATAMKTFTSRLTLGNKATKAQKNAFQEIGIDAVQLSKDIKNDAIPAIKDVFNAIKKAPEYEQGGLIKTIFGEEVLGSVSGIIGQLNVLDDNFRMVADSSKSLEAVKKEYDRLNASDNGKMDKALKALGVTMIRIGDVIVPIFADLAIKFSDFLSEVNELDPGLVRLGVVFGVVAAAVGPVLLTVGSLVAAITPAIISAGGLGAALTAMAASAGPVGIAIAAIIGAGVLLYKNWDEIKSYLVNTINEIVAWFQNWASENSALVSSIKEHWSALIEATSGLWTAISNSVNGIIESLDQMLEPIGGLQGAWTILKDIVGSVLTFLGERLSSFLKMVTENFRVITDVLNGNKGAWEGFKEIIANVSNFVIESIGEIVYTVVSGFKQIWAEIKNINWTQLGKDMMQGLADGIKSSVSIAKAAAFIGAQTVYQAAKDAVKSNSPSLLFKELGQFTMAGLAIGITEATPLAERAAEESAARVLMAYENKLKEGDLKQKELLAKSLGFGDNKEGGKSFAFSSEGFGSSGGFGQQSDSLGLPDLELISTYYDNRLELLRVNGSKETELFKAIESAKTNALAEGLGQHSKFYSSTFDSILSSTKEFAGEQSGIYKALFAVSKGFAVAEAAIALGQNIANASKVGFPQNIPLIAGAFAQGAQIASIISSVSAPGGKAFYNGGRLGSGQSGIAGEKGVEIVGPTGILSTQKTKELFNGSGGSTNVYVNVSGVPSGYEATVNEEGTNDEKQIDIIIKKIEDKFSNDAVRMSGKFVPTMANQFGLKQTKS